MDIIHHSVAFSIFYLYDVCLGFGKQYLGGIDAKLEDPNSNVDNASMLQVTCPS